MEAYHLVSLANYHKKRQKRGKTSWLMDESFLERELTYSCNGVGVENTIFRYVSET